MDSSTLLVEDASDWVVMVFADIMPAILAHGNLHVTDIFGHEYSIGLYNSELGRNCVSGVSNKIHLPRCSATRKQENRKLCTAMAMIEIGSPLLQFALLKTFHRSKDESITLS